MNSNHIPISEHIQHRKQLVGKLSVVFDHGIPKRSESSREEWVMVFPVWVEVGLEGFVNTTRYA